MSQPITGTENLTQAQLSALRQRLGISVMQQSGTLANGDASVDWKLTPAGLEWTVTPHSFRAKMTAQVDPGEIVAQVRKMIHA